MLTRGSHIFFRENIFPLENAVLSKGACQLQQNFILKNGEKDFDKVKCSDFPFCNIFHFKKIHYQKKFLIFFHNGFLT